MFVAAMVPMCSFELLLDCCGLTLGRKVKNKMAAHGKCTGKVNENFIIVQTLAVCSFYVKFDVRVMRIR